MHRGNFCGCCWLLDVFIRECEKIFEEKIWVGKIIERDGIRTRDFENVIHVTDWSATMNTGIGGCSWDLMGVVIIVWVRFECLLSFFFFFFCVCWLLGLLVDLVVEDMC